MFNLIYLIFITNLNFVLIDSHCLKFINITSDEPQAFFRPNYAFVKRKEKPNKPTLSWVFYSGFFVGFLCCFFCANPAYFKPSYSSYFCSTHYLYIISLNLLSFPISFNLSTLITDLISFIAWKVTS